MTPAVELANKIIPSVFDGIEVFAYRLPKDYLKVENLPIVKVTNVNESNTSYASDSYRSRSYRVQIQAFVNINTENIELFCDKLDRTLGREGFFQVYGDDREHPEIECIQVITRQYMTNKQKWK